MFNGVSVLYDSAALHTDDLFALQEGGSLSLTCSTPVAQLCLLQLAFVCMCLRLFVFACSCLYLFALQRFCLYLFARACVGLHVEGFLLICL